MKIKTILAIGVFSLFAQNAGAATPILSGTYNMTVRSYCQPTLVADFGDVTVNNVLYLFVDALDDNTSDPGNAFFQEMLTATLTPSKSNPNQGKLKFTGFQDEASVFLLAETGQRSGTQGEPLGERSTSGSGTYSNTSTTLTAGNATYHIQYAQIDAHGIAHSAVFQGLSAGNNSTTCSDQGELTLQ